MFLISNQGYIPLTNIDVSCIPAFSSTNFAIRDMHFIYPNAAEYLGHATTMTIPCFNMFTIKNDEMNSGATLTLTVVYSLYHVNIKFLRRSQSFFFRSVKAKDESQHWEFLP